MGVLREFYTIGHDWSDKDYLGIDIDWDYAARLVHLSMLEYVKDAIIRFDHLISQIVGHEK